MKCCAVVDTNVLVSALLSKKSDTATVQVFRAMLQGRFNGMRGQHHDKDSNQARTAQRQG